jgi:hypothetical protein
MAIWILILMIVPVMGGIYLARGKARTLRRLEAGLGADIRNRLSAAGREVNGDLAADGRSLTTPQGVMTLAASKAPESFVIDLAKFAGKTSLEGALTIVRKEDAGKVIASKALQVLTPRDPKVAERYHVLVSDVDQGQRWANAKLADALQALETTVRAKIRLQVIHATATLIVFRGLAKPEELKSFYDAAVLVLNVLETFI